MQVSHTVAARVSSILALSEFASWLGRVQAEILLRGLKSAALRGDVQAARDLAFASRHFPRASSARDLAGEAFLGRLQSEASRRAWLDGQRETLRGENGLVRTSSLDGLRTREWLALLEPAEIDAIVSGSDTGSADMARLALLATMGHELKVRRRLLQLAWDGREEVLPTLEHLGASRFLQRLRAFQLDLSRATTPCRELDAEVLEALGLGGDGRPLELWLLETPRAPVLTLDFQASQGSRYGGSERYAGGWVEFRRAQPHDEDRVGRYRESWNSWVARSLFIVAGILPDQKPE